MAFDAFYLLKQLVSAIAHLGGAFPIEIDERLADDEIGQPVIDIKQRSHSFTGVLGRVSSGDSKSESVGLT